MDSSMPGAAHAQPNATSTSAPESSETSSSSESVERDTATTPRRRGLISRRVLIGFLIALALLLGTSNGYLKWHHSSADRSEVSAAQSVSAASETVIALLSYQPDTVDTELKSAADRLTGTFRDEYLTLINDVVIPGSKEKGISATVTVPAAASISATDSDAEVLVFVNQTTTVREGAPSNSVSSVKLVLKKEDERWLVSHFEPV